MKPGVYLAFDFGLRRIGVAIGDSHSLSARPLAVIQRQEKPDWRALEDLLKEWAPVALIVGKPPGGENQRSDIPALATAFAKELSKRYSYTTELHDEHLSSFEAKDRLKSSRQSGHRGRIRHGEKDAAAAAVILQSWFSEQSG